MVILLNSDSMYNPEHLLILAEQARKNAYCKYSGFAVGAALLTESGVIYTGCNIENSSYPVGICAERVAFGKALSDGHRKFRAIAIAGAPEQEQKTAFCPPCGMCRQFMSEFCQDDFEIILSDKIYQMKDLLPVRFAL